MCEYVQEKIITMCSSDTEQREPECLKDDSQDIAVLQKWVDVEMKQMKSLYNRMVINYYRMMTKCKGQEEQLKRCKQENVQFKKIAHRVTKMVKELGCNDLEICANNSNNDGDDNTTITLLEECSKRLKKEVRACKKRAEDAHSERDALGEQLSAANKQLATATEHVAAVNGKLAASAGVQAKLKEHADDVAEAYEKRLAELAKKHADELRRLTADHDRELRQLAELSEQRDRLAVEQCEQYEGRLVELAKKHADETRRLTAEYDERHADELHRLTAEHDRELRRLTDELDATKSSWTREVEDLRQALNELNARAQADKSAAVECAAGQRVSINRLTALLRNKGDLKRTLQSSDAADEMDVLPAVAVGTEPDRPSSLSSTGCDRAGLPHPSSARVMSRTPSSTDSSVTYDMIVRHVAATAVVSPPPSSPPDTVPCDCCEVDDRPRSSACNGHRHCQQVCATVDGTSDSTDCAAVNDHPPSPPPVYECGDVVDDQVENGQPRVSPGQTDNYYSSAVTYDDDDLHVMRLLEKYKYKIEADAEQSSTTDE